ncbi:bifunctional [glutamine synthetase] adenylyltransferase/[glutamine synthetase]-adenylyl-L-tyrosine phosphorylase [Lapillicoccus sp.]|uniref:bifunctional [glutamine synthetase] adenylyltransferase/[glutamine synthetase]-adenylyl-L-tyrosine phosphorylase n=1 Tax=Lapillicoccus sp. TaxID=1909287 RepID=UPI0032660CCA
MAGAVQGASGRRSGTPAGQLARLGFADPARAERLLQDKALKGFADPLDDIFHDGLPDALSQAADPDQALLGLVRVVESLATRRTGPTSDGGALLAALRRHGPARNRLVAVLGGSVALVDHLVSHPEHWLCVAEATVPTARGLRDRLVEAVSSTASPTLPASPESPGSAGTGTAPLGNANGSTRKGPRTDRSPAGGKFPPAYDALRIAYRRELLAIAALDLTSPDPVGYLPAAAEQLSWLAEAALEAALVIARDEFGPGSDDCRLAVIGMGKTGGGELNYVSDVDVIFVAEPAEGIDEERALQVATRLATGMMQACSATTGEGTLWPVDAALRPEGKNGPLVRTITSHRAYYERWAKTWEFQALLKAWVSAGDLEIGTAYMRTIAPFVWEAAGREHFVEDVQAMRRRVEAHVPTAEAERQLKLGRGGLRDVEFSVQLLQLVHGRSDESLRSATTLEALSALAEGGYVGREDATTFGEAYRLLRTLEHRIQLQKLRRTHLMPTSEPDLRRLGRAIGLRANPAKEVVELRQSRSREVRRIHERLFYRPLLNAAAKLTSADTALSPEAARARLSALGFRDPNGAMRHLAALTTGVSRRAAIQRTLLPVMLGWFADEADPDAGILAFRRVSEELGTIHWYLKMLRDEGSSAERLARTLARSRYAADLLISAPESVAILGESSGLAPRTQEQLQLTMASAVSRKEDATGAIGSVHGIRRHELLRIVMTDLNTDLGTEGVDIANTNLAGATLHTALYIATRRVEEQIGAPLGARLAAIGMGSLGGREMGYASDADVLFVYRPTGEVEGLGDAETQRRAVLVVQELLRLMGTGGLVAQLDVDTDLRPEGKNGPLVRSLASYESYYARWAATWEFQALLRARPVGGDPELGADFMVVVDRIRYPQGGLTATQVRDIRVMKARVESERLPRGADRRTHLKLGLGGLSDVEWMVQLVQLQHGYDDPALRVTGTMAGLDAVERGGYLTPGEAQSLRVGWGLAASLRNAAVLWRGRPVASVPSDLRDADGIGRIVGRRPGAQATLEEDYMRVSRRCRAVVEANFYQAR